MKKILTILAGISLLSASSCFIVKDASITLPDIITTKIVDKPFTLAVSPICGVNDYNVTLVSEDNIIYNSESNVKGLYNVEINNSYKDVKVVIKYHRVFSSATLTEEVENHFAVRPYKFDVKIPTSTFVNTISTIKVNAISYKGNVVTNYNNTSYDLYTSSTDSDIVIGYMYKIEEGLGKGEVYIFDKGETSIKILDKDFADVDTDDTNDNQRFISGESNKIIAKKKSGKYSGVYVKDTATTNTINTDIKQNINKDLHYNKLEW